MIQATEVLREDVQEVPRLRVVGDIDLAAVRQVQHSVEEHVRDISGTARSSR